MFVTITALSGYIPCPAVVLCHSSKHPLLCLIHGISFDRGWMLQSWSVPAEEFSSQQFPECGSIAFPVWRQGQEKMAVQHSIWSLCSNIDLWVGICGVPRVQLQHGCPSALSWAGPVHCFFASAAVDAGFSQPRFLFSSGQLALVPVALSQPAVLYSGGDSPYTPRVQPHLWTVKTTPSVSITWVRHHHLKHGLLTHHDTIKWNFSLRPSLYWSEESHCAFNSLRATKTVICDRSYAYSCQVRWP